ncbi:Gfo/Idh/MocA family oxidoreductase [Streptomyces sp. KLMMK]|uniref:Gfo/Idh/MocA family protein n=1 Tax=Streptomyces sp. KLMMK TaxID=3109353 RepID=UPI0030002681
MKNILVIGVGPHARRTHLPALAAGQGAGLVGTVTGVDIPAAQAPLTGGTDRDGPSLPVVLIDPFDPTLRDLPHAVRSVLDTVVRRRGIDAVVISTEPAYHLAYTRWALEHGLSVLLDKPLSVHAHCSSDPRRARAILSDYEEILACYQQARKHHPQLLVSVLCQRRYHPAFWRMRDLIAEVAEETNCPVTSIQSFHSDGQWRMPDELIDITYHGFDQGYGKCAHSGYHFFDIVPWLLTAGERSGKELDTVEIHAHVTRPADVLAQLGVADHERLFPGFAARNPYTLHKLRTATARFGEVDAFLSMAYKSGGHAMTLGSLNLVHNGFSQRGNLTPATTSLYKGNGRVRHETHIIEQGPFQALHFHSLQTLGSAPPGADPYALGSENHVEVHVFRNDQLRPAWTKHTALGYEALTTTWGSEMAVPTQESSRQRAINEFLEYLNGRVPRERMLSELTSHRRASTLMAGAYLSMANQRAGTSPVTTLGFRTTPLPESSLLPAQSRAGAAR